MTHLPFDDLLLANIRLLFHKSVDVRNEALSRVMFIVSSHPDADRFLPNINNITDVVPSDICVVRNQWDPSVSASTPTLYTPDIVISLINSLAATGVDPKMRRVTLMQLNVIATVPSVCKTIVNHNGLQHAVDALRNSLMAAHNVDYPDAALSVVGLLAKLSTHSMHARRELRANGTQVLLCRALLLFHKNEALQRDCSVALFLVAFADFVLGESNVSAPQLLVDLLHVPIVCKTHWTMSPFVGQSPLIDALLRHQQSSAEWQFVRFTIASLFFGDAPQVHANAPLVYPALEFNSKLHLNQDDCRLLHASDQIEFLKYTLRSVGNATTHPAVLSALAYLQSFAMVPIDKTRLGSAAAKECINVVRRFLCVLPNTVPDQHVFLAVMEAVLNLIGIGMDELHSWTLGQLCRQLQCALLVTLQSSDAPSMVVQAVCRFVRAILRRAVHARNTVELSRLLLEKVDGTDANTLVYLYERVVSVLDEKFERREFGRNYSKMFRKIIILFLSH